MNKEINNLTIAIGFMMVAILSVALLPKFELDLDANCEAEGIDSRLKARFQGARFWRSQLWYLDREIADLRALPDQLRAINRTVTETRRQLDDHQKSVYQQNPSTRPSSERAAAEVLRRRADSVETAGVERVLDASVLEQLRQLSSCRPLVAAHVPGQE